MKPSLKKSSDKQKHGTRTVSPARLLAAQILQRVEETQSYASVLLAELGEDLSPEDRGLCQALVLGVLRNQLWLDAITQHLSGRPIETLDVPVRIALRLGLFQLRFLSRMPPSAAVNESVNLAYAFRVRSASGFINAVLRRSLRESDFDPSAEIADPITRLSIETSHPKWLIERWLKQFGFEQTRAFAISNNQPAPVAFRLGSAKTPEPILEKIKKAGGRVFESAIVACAWRVEGAATTVRELATSGQIYIQDESSQLVAHMLGAVEGDRILDACAAPGSKSTLIARLAGGQTSIVAVDLNESRLHQIRTTSIAQRLKNLELLAMDSAAPAFASETFDRVLVDAPCTGTGTLRRNPEIRWRITPDGISGLCRAQLAILNGIARTVRVGGRMIYSTCSVETDENEQVIEAFLGENPGFSPVSPTQADPAVSKGSQVRLWPQAGGSDGFFATAVTRRS